MKIFICLLLFILFPLLVTYIGSKLDHSRNDTKNTILTLLFSNISIAAVYFLFSRKISPYGLVFANAAAASFFDRILLKLITKKCEKRNVLEFICGLSIIVAGYSILTYGQATIDSDVATATILTKSIVEHKSWFPKSFNYANGDIWVISIWPECFFPFLIFKDQSFARAFGSLILVMLAVICVVYQSKKLFKNRSYLIAVPLFLIYLFGVSRHVLYEASYTSQILWMALCSVWLYQIYKETTSRKVYIALYSILLLLLNMGGTRTLAEQTLPLLCACVIMQYLEIREEQEINWKPIVKKQAGLFGITMIPSVIGIGIYKWLCTWHNVNNTVNNQTVFVDSLKTVWDNIVITVCNLFECFGFSGSAKLVSVYGLRNFVSVVMCVIVCIVVPVLQALKFKQEKEEVRFFYVFAIVHNLIMILLSVFFGKTLSRYLLTTVFAFIIVSSRYIYVYWIEQKGIRQYVWVGLFVIASLIECAGMGLKGLSWEAVVTDRKEFNQQIIDHGVTKGYATYGNAYKNEVYSDLKIRFGAVNITNDSVSPFTWLVDGDVFTAEKGIQTFLLLSEDENNLIKDNISNLFGSPVEEFMINNMYIYIFDHDIAIDMCGGSRDELNDGTLLPGDLYITEGGGTITKDRIEITQGGISYGPYISLEAGEYLVTFAGENFDKAVFDIYSNSEGEYLSYEEIERTGNSIVVKMILSETVNNLEFRIYNVNESGVIYLEYITVEDSAM